MIAIPPVSCLSSRCLRPTNSTVASAGSSFRSSEVQHCEHALALHGCRSGQPHKAEVTEGRKKYLKCRQPLLTIDDLTLWNVSNWRLLLIENHSAQKVDRGVLACLQLLCELPRDIFPKRLPLLVTLPDILPLKHRHFQPKFVLKDPQQGRGVGLHLTSPAVNQPS